MSETSWDWILSLTVRTALPNLKSDTLPTLLLLNHLATSGYMSRGLDNVQGGRWRQTLVSTLRDHLVSLSEQPRDGTDRRILVQTLRLLSHLSIEGRDFAPTLAQLARRFAGPQGSSVDSAIENWNASGPLNDGHLLSLVLRCASAFISDQQVRTALTNVLEDEKGLTSIIRRWHWNAEVMETLVDLAERADLPVTYAVFRQSNSYETMLTSQTNSIGPRRFDGPPTVGELGTSESSIADLDQSGL